MIRKEDLEMEKGLLSDLMEGALQEEGYRLEPTIGGYKAISPRGLELTIYLRVTT